MEFKVHPEIFSAFPDMRIAVAVATSIDNRAQRGDIQSAWRAAWLSAQEAAQFGNAQSHPRVASWWESMRAVGVSGKQFPSSIEALLRRALKGGEPFQINPLVDFYNTVSLRHVVPAGGFDLAHVAGPLELRLTRDGDTFQALDDESSIPVPSGEIAYADGSTILTRHFVWRQSREALITDSTRSVMLLSEILGEVGEGVAQNVLEDFHRGLHDHFNCDSHPAMVDRDHNQITLR
jgi:DNA/RNA-binding domain of Phe-tRNA-synthetase-like protein